MNELTEEEIANAILTSAAFLCGDEVVDLLKREYPIARTTRTAMLSLP